MSTRQGTAAKCKRRIEAIDLTGDSPSRPKKVKPLAGNERPDPKTIAALSRFEKIEAEVNAANQSTPASYHNFEALPKLSVRFGVNEYEVYPSYQRDDLVPLIVPGDPAPEDDCVDPRFLIGPKWWRMSCAIDTFLWVSTICNIRRVRADAPLEPTLLASLAPLSQLVVRYLRLPLAILSQDQVDALRNSIYQLVFQDERMHFDPDVGMDVNNLFTFAWRSIAPAPELPLHAVCYTEARIRRCQGCSGYGLRRSYDRLGINTSEQRDLGLGEHLQEYFLPESIYQSPACVMCGGQTFQQRILMDRLPSQLLWLDGCTGKPLEEYFQDVKLQIEVMDEVEVVCPHETWVYAPKVMSVSYRPVVLVIRDTATYEGGMNHWYAASSLPCRDSGDWLVYDDTGAGNGGAVTRKVRVKQFLKGLKKKGGHDVHVVILKKVVEEEIELREEDIEAVGEDETEAEAPQEEDREGH